MNQEQNSRYLSYSVEIAAVKGLGSSTNPGLMDVPAIVFALL